jgi:hypothetical protein
MAKTDWQLGDVVQPADMNQIGQEINSNAEKIVDHETRLSAAQTSITELQIYVGDMSTVPTAAKTAAGAIKELHDNPVPPADGSITDAKIGLRTIDDTVTASDGADTPTRLWSKLGNVLKKLMGTANWWMLPSMSISAIITELGLKAPLESPDFIGTPKVSGSDIITRANLNHWVNPGGQSGGHNYWVDPVNGVDAPGGGTQDRPFKSIAYAFNQFDKHMIGNYTLTLKAGTYTEPSINMTELEGPYTFTIQKDYNAAAGSVILQTYLAIMGLKCNEINIYGLTVRNNPMDLRTFLGPNKCHIKVSNCIFDGTFPYGIIISEAALRVTSCVFNSRTTAAISASGPNCRKR